MNKKNRKTRRNKITQKINAKPDHKTKKNIKK